MKLDTLVLHGTPVSDLTPLEGMPLTRLDLGNCKNVTDVAPVLKIPTLQQLTVPWGARNIGLLRRMPNLKRISYELSTATYDGSRPSYEADTNAADFWRECDANPWVARLTDAGISLERTKRQNDGTWEADFSRTALRDLELLRGAPFSSLTLENTAVSDLQPLRGMPLKSLKLNGTAVTDLSPLHGMPLENLSISGTGVADLAPLAGMPLKQLDAGNTAVTDLEPLRGLPLRHLRLFNDKVTDLSPLAGMKLGTLVVSGTRITNISVVRGMPLTSVALHGCSELTDLSPLAEDRTLVQLTLPPKARDFEFLRGFPKLEYLSFSETGTGIRRPDKLAGEFWGEYDARKP
jgi:Leucine-rich repeat (LRR) protein